MWRFLIGSSETESGTEVLVLDRWLTAALLLAVGESAESVDAT
jgi:hypothetical protein